MSEKNQRTHNIFKRMEEPGSALQLAIFRIFMGLGLFYYADSELIKLLLVVDGNQETLTIFPSFLEQWVQSIIDPYLIQTIKVLSILLVLGFLTKYILPILFLSSILFFSFWYLKFNAPVPWLYIWFPLLVLCLSRCADKLSLDAYLRITSEEKEIRKIYRWPVELVTGWFAYIYVAAGLAKIIPLNNSLDWVLSGTSQSIIHDRYLESFLFYLFEQPLFDYTEYKWIFIVLSFLALIIELSCISLLLTRRLHFILVSSVLLMHFSLWTVGVQGFVFPALLLSVCLISPHSFEREEQ